MNTELKKNLEDFALDIRIWTVEAIAARGFGHIGGSLSVCDTLAVLYGDVMKYDPKNPSDENRDKLVCSKGHAGPAVYAALGLKGFFPIEDVKTLNQNGTNFPSHCDKNKTPGVDMTTGSLGQGSSLAVGMAMGDKMRGKSCKTYLIVGDGELNEGQIWEAAMFTAAKKVNNLVWIIDWNKRQLDGATADILDLGNIEAKFASFGFDAKTIVGDDIEGLHAALIAPTGDKPLAIVLDSVKGKGVKEIEESAGNHSMAVSKEVFDGWLAELRAKKSN